jgi:ABC-type Fe3+ transport system permease subunit
MRWRYFTPLIGFVVPTLLIGFGFVIPRSPIAGVNDLTIGFALTVAGACATYFFGIRAVVRELAADAADGPAEPPRPRVVKERSGSTGAAPPS